MRLQAPIDGSAARRHHVIEPYSLDIIPIPLSWKWLWSTGVIDQGGMASC